MSRKKRSAFDDLIDMAASLPWWLSLLLAGVSYLVIHSYASAPTTAPDTVNPGQMGQAVAGQFFHALAMAGQYLVPAGLVIGAVVSAIGRLKRKALLQNTATATSPGAAKSLSWQEFEMLIGEMFRNQGFGVKETTKGADGGVDLELRKAGELSLVQCKQWRATKVGVSVVRELFGVMAARAAVHGYVVTTGGFTSEARKFAQGRNITLIDGQVVEREIRRQAKSNSNVASIKGERRRPLMNGEPKSTSQTTSADLSVTVPPCPKCGGEMVKRVARKGANAGKAFWGCSRFPKCRGTLPIE